MVGPSVTDMQEPQDGDDEEMVGPMPPKAKKRKVRRRHLAASSARFHD